MAVEQCNRAQKPAFPPLQEIINQINVATGSLHAIQQLALDAINVGDRPEQGAYLVAITDMARLHGRALDRCAEALTNGAPQTGCFDDWPDGPYNAPEDA